MMRLIKDKLKPKNYHKYIGLQLVNIGNGYIGECISFRFRDKNNQIIGFRIYIKDIGVVETFKETM
jgi:hypothetical protein